MTDKKTEAWKLELKRIRSIIVQITGLDDEDEENLGDAYRSLGLVIDSLAEQPAIPEGYALISIDVLKAWGKYDIVRDACQYQLEPAAQHQEPVAWMTPTGALYRTEDVDGCFDDKHIPIYTPPPASKPWVGLTDEEVIEIHNKSLGKYIGVATGLTEAKLKEKNA